MIRTYWVLAMCLITGCSDDQGSGGNDATGSDTSSGTDVTAVIETDSAHATDTEPVSDTAPETTVEADTTVADTTVVEEPDTDLNPCAGLCAIDELCGFDGTCYCTPGRTRACDIKFGDCRDGVRACVDGAWAPCAPIPKDEPEVCDGHDNDCDGSTDEAGVCLPPNVACPPPRVVDIGERTLLDATASDPDGGDLEYFWTLTDTPAGAGVGLEPQDEPSTELVPDASGPWHIELCVNDDEGIEACCQTEVDVREPCVQPPAPTITACGTSWDRRPIVQFAPLAAGHRYAIEVDGVPHAEVTLVGQNYYRPPTAIGVGGPPPGTAAVLGVRECVDTCCSEPATATVALVESCDTPIAPSSENLIISEYMINGDGTGNKPCPGPNCEAGEAIEITNLSHCPVSLANHHLRYCNNVDCTSARRYDDFASDDVIPPRGVFVRIRNPANSTCGFDFLPATDSTAIFGIRRSTLELEVDGSYNNDSGWFNNNASGSLRIATGAYASPTSGTTILLVEGYVANQTDCESVGFDALGACGDITAGVIPTEELRDNQLGRLWHPCDAVVNAYPTTCFD